jgi:Rieske Fe-S protein
MSTDLAFSRRGVLRGALVTAVGAVAGFLVARGSAAARAGRGTTAANAYGPATNGDERPLVGLDEVPPGGGTVLRDAAVVLTRTVDGELHAFSAVCTHQGCTVDAVADGSIDCPCHGSRFDALTGAVTNGPAARPLPPVAVVVRDGQVYSS